MEISIPKLSLVALVGPSSSGKSSFAKQHFKATEILSSDYYRAVVSDSEDTKNASKDAFELLHCAAGIRLKRGNLTVIDATNVQEKARKELIRLSKNYHCLPVAIVFALPLNVIKERHKDRKDRNFGMNVIYNHFQDLKRSIKRLRKEGFKKVYVLKTEEEVNNAFITREPLWNDKSEETGPFDIIGDVHGCYDELLTLLQKLDYQFIERPELKYGFEVKPPEGRKAIFVGDLTDRGPKNMAVLKLVMSMVANNTALCVIGNHDFKLLKKLKGANVTIQHGLDITLAELEHETDVFKADLTQFLKGLISHYILDNGKLVVAHAGIKENMQGRGSAAVRSFCMFGETTGQVDEFGLPIRIDWAKDYRGYRKVVYGHTVVPESQWLNNTLNIDTGCVFGGKLTALKYPEQELVQIEAFKTYAISPKSLFENNNDLSQQLQHDDLLDIKDVIGQRTIHTQLQNSVRIGEAQSIAALETVSRFGINHKWMIYLPPTMSPCSTSNLPNYLEHPLEAFEYYKKNDVTQVVCQEKHMGSRALILVLKNKQIAMERFGVQSENLGIVYTRTGRPFFTNKELEEQVLFEINKAVSTSNLWEEFDTNWLLLDTEIMPWTYKAKSLITNQYASVGASGKASLNAVNNALELFNERALADNTLTEHYRLKQDNISKYTDAYSNYTAPCNSINDIKIAPFHLLASKGKVFTDKNHLWHMKKLQELSNAKPDLLIATQYKLVNLNNDNELENVTNWWLNLTSKGGEGMVVKPLDFIAKKEGRLLQPAIKCRGKEYLRIIYGADYTLEENMIRLKKRKLNFKQKLALREFSLGVEALERFTKKQPLRKVHECVFGVLALESEKVDPRL